MASNINPTNIDVTYPIAGQDNDTQGFRDNFSNIKNNLNVAKGEISAIQDVLDTTPLIKVTVPASATDVGTRGQIAFDSNYLYVCIATNTWVRTGLINWPSSLPMFYGNSNVAAYLSSTTIPALTVTTENVTDINVSGTLTTSGPRVDAAYQYSAPTTNFTYTMQSTASRFIMDPTGPITNGNILLPSGNVEARVVTISSTQTVTNFKVTPNLGTTLVPSANVTLSAGTSVSYFFHAAESKWYKIA